MSDYDVVRSINTMRRNAPGDIERWDGTDPTPVQRERPDDGLLRAAANLALVVIPGEVGEQVRIMMWTYYNTDKTRVVSDLAKAIVAARPR